jgi:D-sedoheptulose 7-phosphate isomerase
MPEEQELFPTNIHTEIQFDLSTFDPVDDYLNRLSVMLGQIKREQVNSVIELLFNAWKARKQVFILGNGGSATTAAHMANDLCKATAIEGKKRFKAFSLVDNVSLITALSNDIAYENIFAEQLINYLEHGDVVIAISTSGNSPNVLRALEIAKDFGAVRVGFTGLDGGKLKTLVDACIHIPDEQMERQEDGHLILDHVISTTLRWMIAGEAE